MKLRNPGQKKGPFPGTSCAALDTPLNLSELLFSHWEIRKIKIIIIIPKVMTVMNIQIINVTVLSLIIIHVQKRYIYIIFIVMILVSIPINSSDNSLILSQHINFL